MAAFRGTARLAERVTPHDLVVRLNNVTEVLVSAVEGKDGTVYMQVGGDLLAYWHPSEMPAAVKSAFLAASEIVAACGTSVAVSIAVAELALADVGPATSKRPLLVGAAHQRAERTLQAPGTVAIDLQTFDVLPTEISILFAPKDGHAELK